MSKFRVGQRVRVVKPILRPEMLGAEAVVLDVGAIGFDPARGEFISGILIDLIGPNGMGHVCYEWQLEPATDCYDKTEWDACVWKPEHLRVGA